LSRASFLSFIDKKFRILSFGRDDVKFRQKKAAWQRPSAPIVTLLESLRGRHRNSPLKPGQLLEFHR
ncbi:hypothetical protein ACQKK5_26240, partial [Brevibacillus panacihumi]|uniref:hypothetical protein n=1 Tax=Brevibacillus panacihumi TaxID=497735 RepID=UPI003D022F12